MKIFTSSKTITFHFKYFFVMFSIPEGWKGLYRCWDFRIPKYQNWDRLTIMTPFIDFVITGWLFWGKKPIYKG